MAGKSTTAAATIDPNISNEKQSIIDLLHDRVSTNRQKNKTKQKQRQLNKSNEPKILEQSNKVELMETPGVTNELIFKQFSVFDAPILKTRTRTEYRNMKNKEMIRQVFGGGDDDDDDNNNSNNNNTDKNDNVKQNEKNEDNNNNNNNTNNKNNTDEIAKANTIKMENDIKNGLITYDQQYQQYLAKLNIDFSEPIKKKYVTTATITSTTNSPITTTVATMSAATTVTTTTTTVASSTLTKDVNKIDVAMNATTSSATAADTLTKNKNNGKISSDNEVVVSDQDQAQEYNNNIIDNNETIANQQQLLPSRIDDSTIFVQPLSNQRLLKVKKGNRAGRRKGSSGFDYIRKKKKPLSSTQPKTGGGAVGGRRKVGGNRGGIAGAAVSNDGINGINKLSSKYRSSSINCFEGKDENDINREIRGWVLNKGVGESALHKAARLGYIDVIAFCLERLNMDPDQKDNAGYTPLHEACSKGRIDIARILLEYGANHSETAHSGIRPLHEAVENGYVEIVLLLLSYGADPLLATYGGQTPLMLAGEDDEMVSLLKNHLQDVQNTGPNKLPWKFEGPWKIYDPNEDGCNIFGDCPEEIADIKMTSSECVDAKSTLLASAAVTSTTTSGKLITAEQIDDAVMVAGCSRGPCTGVMGNNAKAGASSASTCATTSATITTTATTAITTATTTTTTTTAAAAASTTTNATINNNLDCYDYVDDNECEVKGYAETTRAIVRRKRTTATTTSTTTATSSCIETNNINNNINNNNNKNSNEKPSSIQLKSAFGGAEGKGGDGGVGVGVGGGGGGGDNGASTSAVIASAAAVTSTTIDTDCDEGSDGDLFEFEESDVPLMPLYLLRDEGTDDKWVLLNDLCSLLKVKSKDSLLKQICPANQSININNNKDILREFKMNEFLEKAICLQLLYSGEKINIRASKVTLVKYNNIVKKLLNVNTVTMRLK